jgi:hypothetical protein
MKNRQQTTKPKKTQIHNTKLIIYQSFTQEKKIRPV